MKNVIVSNANQHKSIISVSRYNVYGMFDSHISNRVDQLITKLLPLVRHTYPLIGQGFDNHSLYCS